MDKRVIFATAGSGKTTHIVNSLTNQKRSLVITYTQANYSNLQRKISNKFAGLWPDNITLMTYFNFLYRFCYKPFLSDEIGAKGLCYENNPNQYAKQDQIQFYLSKNKNLYSNRLSLLLGKEPIMSEIKNRIMKYFDEFIIDEVQDFAGRDFNFIESLTTVNINVLFVGDFYQHTFDTSRDGNVNKSLFHNKAKYEERFINNGFTIDNTTLKNSWRCSRNVCDYIRRKIDIDIYSNRLDTDNTKIEYITNIDSINRIIENDQIIKLHYQNSSKLGPCHKNWGESKGEDHYTDVCVILNKNTLKHYKKDIMHELPQATKNKLYVAITRARGNVYFIDDCSILYD